MSITPHPGAAQTAPPSPLGPDGIPVLYPTVEQPVIPPRVRTVAYFVGLVAGGLVLLTVGIAPIWFEPEIAEQVVSTAGVLSGVFAFIAGGLGVAYRPTR